MSNGLLRLNSLARALESRRMFIVVTACGCIPVWFAPHLPLADLPQHAAQVAAARDLLLGVSAWTDLLRLNFLTPYLVGYLPAIALSFVLPVGVSLKMVLCVAYLLFVVGWVRLRTAFGGEPRLDWLFVPGFWGLAYQWGFYPFLVASAAAPPFLLIAYRHLEKGGIARAAAVAVAGLGLFFCHGLIFIFCWAVAAGWVVSSRGFSVTGRWRLLVPYIALGGVAAVYFVYVQVTEPAVRGSSPPLWGTWYARTFGFFVHPWTASIRDSLWAIPGLAFFAAPMILSTPLQRRLEAFVMFALLLAAWAVVPEYGIATANLYRRFATFILPAYAMMFSKALEAPASPRRMISRSTVSLALPLICFAFFLYRSVCAYEFSVESADADAALNSIPAQKRIMFLVPDPASTAGRTVSAYANYPAWYQAEHGGFVCPNFAKAHAPLVRYKSAAAESSIESFNDGEWQCAPSETFDFVVLRVGLLDRHVSVKSRRCSFAIYWRSAQWVVYQRKDCVAAAPIGRGSGDRESDGTSGAVGEKPVVQ